MCLRTIFSLLPPLLLILPLLNLPLTAHAKKLKTGPEIFGTHNPISESDMHQAIFCLHANVCSKGPMPSHSKARCTINDSVAYMCNYRGTYDFKGTKRDCDIRELYEAWAWIRVTQNSSTGWYYDGEWTAGFDRRCKNGECDNGWKKGSEGEQCTNIGGGKKVWLIDYEGEEYPGYHDRYEERLPEVGDTTSPLKYMPWTQGKRPR